MLKSLLAKAGVYVYRRPAEEVFYQALIDRTENFSHLRWMGEPIWQSVSDLWTLQETLCEIRPDLLIETGTNRGGSARFYAQLFDRLDHGRIITIDVETLHTLNHPRVECLLGSSTDPAILERVRQTVTQTPGPVMVILDSDHSAGHVRKEMEVYAPFVTPDSFLHVQDGVLDQGYYGPLPAGPLTAIEGFLPSHPEFTVDHQRCTRFVVTHHPLGWLKKRR